MAVVGVGSADPIGEVMVKSRSNNPLDAVTAGFLGAVRMGLEICGLALGFAEDDEAEREEEGGPERRSIESRAGAGAGTDDKADGVREGGLIEAAGAGADN